MSEGMEFTREAPVKIEPRYGVITAKIGSEFVHTIGIEIELNEPEYSCFAPGSPAPNDKVKSGVNKSNPHYKYGEKADANGRIGFKRTHALPGSKHLKAVEDISRLQPELAKHVKWECRHPECAGKKFASKAECVRSHRPNKDLRREQQTHLIYGVLELAATKDAKTGETTPAYFDLLSDEE